MKRQRRALPIANEAFSLARTESLHYTAGVVTPYIPWVAKH